MDILGRFPFSCLFISLHSHFFGLIMTNRSWATAVLKILKKYVHMISARKLAWYVYFSKWSSNKTDKIRMHSSRMRTACSSSRPGGWSSTRHPPPEQIPQEQTPLETCCKACWDTTCNACWDSITRRPAARHAEIPPAMHAGIHPPPPMNRITHTSKT